MGIRINPSILSADFANFEREIGRITNADFVHTDVMDNHFVPNLTFGMPMVARLSEVSPVPLDVHLMIEDADRWAPLYAETGAQVITFHYEACQDAVSTARAVRMKGSQAGIAIKPNTDVQAILPHLAEFDQVLVMTVEPGFGGQSFMPDMMPKLHALKQASAQKGLSVWLQVDGGITEETIVAAAEAGADTFVAGSSVFNQYNAAANIENLRTIAQNVIDSCAQTTSASTSS